MANCAHDNKTVGYDSVTCRDCGAFRTDSGWGIAANRWFSSRHEAEFYKTNGRLPDPLPTTPPTPRLVPDRPSDYVLVPRIPTYQMAEAMGVKWESGDGFPQRYAAMLAAAPPAEAPAERGGG